MAAKLARFYTMSPQEQKTAVCEDWADDLCNAGHIRLQVALERIVGKRTMMATFAE
ncbi:hypothetical protein [uncultured Hyphomicrobium sp.]|uniref:hypothetical protein n=1 Tax=uncultured Hyphomicrobium sp. TaxID=194373 RepID=UPI0025DD72C9|nr:hypothetical protein [uncultured Hyphomicrobium sp.]